MAEESDLSRTEPASPRRLQQARNEGDVPRSAELTAWVALFSALAALGWGGPKIFASLTQQFQIAFQSVAQPFPAEPFAPWLSLVSVLLPVLVLIFVAVLVAPMLLSGWVFSPRAMQFNAQRLNPFLVFTRLFSLDGVYVIGKTLLKFALIVGVCWLMLSSEWTQLRALPLGGFEESFRTAAALLLQGLLAVTGTLAVIAIADAGWQWWRYRARHAMTWQEVLAEAKESEGSPEMRGRMLARQQAAAGQASANPLHNADETTSKARLLPNPPPEGEGTNMMPKAGPLMKPLANRLNPQAGKSLVIPNPDEATSHSTDETPGHSTRLSKNDNQVAGYKPASGQVAGYLPEGEGTNAKPKATP